MPLQNRVTPMGDIVAIPERGSMMGNRGGRIHDENRRLGRRHWTSRRWICCETEFNGMWRQVMGPGYTELFFLDEITALAAGHRPCFFCRREAAKAFAIAFSIGQGSATVLGVDAIDTILHAERLDGKTKRLHIAAATALPDGTVVFMDQEPTVIWKGQAFRWTAAGWSGAVARPQAQVTLVTPPSIVAAMASGYRPRAPSSR